MDRYKKDIQMDEWIDMNKWTDGWMERFFSCPRTQDKCFHIRQGSK